MLLRYFAMALFTISLCLSAYADSTPSITHNRSLPHQAVAIYIKQLSQRYQLDPQKLKALFSKFQYNPQVIYHMTHPYEKKPWYFYQQHFVTQQRINSGVNYWREHQQALSYAQKRYGIPASIIVAILGMETNYGKRIGKYPAFDTLATLAFHYPPRKKFFTSELTQFLLLTRDLKLDPLTIKSSYAGALGIPQFMPRTYHFYAVSYKSAKPANLFTNNNDSIVSVANFLAKHHWRRNQPITDNVSNQTIDKRLLSSRAKPKYRVTYLRSQGIKIKEKTPARLRGAIIELTENQQNQKVYFVTFENFYVLTRYNRSLNYAMSAYQLSQAIKKAFYEKST